jgi:DNA-binding MarR family transcriptional regulator
MKEPEGNRANKKDITNLKDMMNNPVNKAILDLMSGGEPISAGDIIKKLKMSPNTCLKHILELKQAGLIDKNINPPDYNINMEKYVLLKQQI